MVNAPSKGKSPRKIRHRTTPRHTFLKRTALNHLTSHPFAKNSNRSLVHAHIPSHITVCVTLLQQNSGVFLFVETAPFVISLQFLHRETHETRAATRTSGYRPMLHLDCCPTRTGFSSVPKLATKCLADTARASL